MPTFKRFHGTGSDATVRKDQDGWHITINLSEANQKPTTIVGFLVPTFEAAKLLADHEISKHGHVCSDACKDWERV